MSGQGTALLVMDMQEPIVKLIKDSAPLLDAVAAAIGTARGQGIPVIFGMLAFRKGFPEVSPDNKAFSRIKTGTLPFDTEELNRIHAAVAPQAGEIIVTKKRVSTFTGSDLEVVLRSFGIRHLVLTGISTSGVILSTTREAADKDYAITILSDGCADADEEVHRVLTTKIFPRQANVMRVEEWRGQSA